MEAMRVGKPHQERQHPIIHHIHHLLLTSKRSVWTKAAERGSRVEKDAEGALTSKNVRVNRSRKGGEQTRDTPVPRERFHPPIKSHGEFKTNTTIIPTAERKGAPLGTPRRTHTLLGLLFVVARDRSGLWPRRVASVPLRSSMSTSLSAEI